MEHRKLNKAEWEKNQEKEKRIEEKERRIKAEKQLEKAEKELKAMKEKAERLQKELKKKGAWIPANKEELREKALDAVEMFTTRHSNIRTRDEDAKRLGMPTRQERGGLYRPTMTPVDRKAKVEKEIKDSQYTLDIANARFMLRPQACTDRRLTVARRALHACIATLDSDPEDADQSDDTVRASKLLRLLERRDDPAVIRIESEPSDSEPSESESEENSSDSSSTRVGEKRKKKATRRSGSKKKKA